MLIPHGIYDLCRNRGHINLGLSHDTSRFACDSFRWYWNRIGKQCYPEATSILWLCDCGGSNSATQYLFKQDLQNMVNELGVEIRVAHDPSYCSKYNPIERRFFPHVGRPASGAAVGRMPQQHDASHQKSLGSIGTDADQTEPLMDRGKDHSNAGRLIRQLQ